MQVELIGCTGAGKSTLLQAMLQVCKAEGIKAASAEDHVLRRAGLSWVKGPLGRSLLLDLVAIPFALMARRANRGFFQLAFHVISSLPRSVPWWERLNIARNVLKKIGMHEVVRRTAAVDQLVIADEGTVHTAHYLFVHVSAELPEQQLAGFGALVPLPDALVLLREDEHVLVARTLARGHKRIPAASPELADVFIRRAVHTFDALSELPRLRERTFQVKEDGSVSGPEAGSGDSTRPALLRILREAVEIARGPRPLSLASSKSIEAVTISHDTGTH